MATYLFTLSGVRAVNEGVRLSPGVRVSEAAARPAMGRMTQGVGLELRPPGGGRHQTVLVTYGIELEEDAGGNDLLRDDPANAQVKLTLPPNLPPDALLPGTEVWLLD